MAHVQESPSELPELFGEGPRRKFTDDRLVAGIVSRLDGKEGDVYHVDDTFLDLTGHVADGIPWLFI